MLSTLRDDRGGYLLDGDHVANVPLTIRTGESVRVSYTDPTTGDDARAIQDSDGTDAPSFSEFEMVNASVIAATVPSEPRDVTATAYGTNRIKLSWKRPARENGRAVLGYIIRHTSEWDGFEGNPSEGWSTWSPTQAWSRRMRSRGLPQGRPCTTAWPR